MWLLSFFLFPFFLPPILPQSFPPSFPSLPSHLTFLPALLFFLLSLSLLSPSSFVCFAMMTISFLLKVDHNLRILNFVVSIIIMIIIRGKKKKTQWGCNQYGTTTMMLAHYLTIIFSKEILFLTSYIVFISIDQNSR